MAPNLQPLIFVVDDDRFYLKMIEQQFKSASYTRLHTFTTGDSCINNLHLMPDIILLDYNLRETTGIEVLKKIKLYNQDAFVFFLSAQEEIEVAINSLKHGAFGYVVKDEFAFRNILEEIKGIISYQAIAQEGKYVSSRFIGLSDYVAEREQKEQIVTTKNGQLTKLNSELDQFVYSTSHNLRGPLTSMMGLIKLARIEEEFHKETFLTMMESMVHKLDHTLKDIIDHSANARTEIKSEPVDLKEMINLTFKNLAYLEGAAYISTQITIEQECSFFSDINRLKIIFHNLASNAIQYHDLSKPLPLISVNVSVKKDRALITFTDNGSGIPEVYTEKIFDMFTRGTTKSSGSGLGLYIVKETINMLKGHITVSTKPAQGTTFHIELPNYHF
jgi:signal transduction histidine kinase